MRRVPGERNWMTRTVLIPAREGRAVPIDAGRRFRVVDVEGGQVADTWAFCAEDLSEYQSAEHTRVHVNKLFPKIGEHFVTNRRQPILLFEEDASPGVHDMLCAACDPTRYAALGVEGWHASCQENLANAMAEVGQRKVEVPQPINLFMNTPALSDGTIDWMAASTAPGDYVAMRAELDIYLVVSACPQDITDINQKKPTPIAIELVG